MILSRKHLLILISLCVIFALGYFVVEYQTAKRLSALTTTVTERISEQRDVLKALSEITARNGADDATELVVQDCNVSERKAFDSLLGTLDQGLAVDELRELDRLFGRCGYYFAQRKAIMVARLTREVQVYEAYVQELELLTGSAEVEQYKVPIWNTLAKEEEKQSQLFTELVKTQDRIIATLLSGKSADSPEIQTILAEVKETQETLTVTNKQTADMRATLLAE